MPKVNTIDNFETWGKRSLTLTAFLEQLILCSRLEAFGRPSHTCLGFLAFLATELS